jgi:hypothetical protein
MTPRILSVLVRRAVARELRIHVASPAKRLRCRGRRPSSGFERAGTNSPQLITALRKTKVPSGEAMESRRQHARLDARTPPQITRSNMCASPAPR